MLILSDVNTSIRVVLNAAQTTAPVRCAASYRDTTTTTFAPGSFLSSANSVTPVAVVPSPPVSTQRVVDFLSVFNSDSTNKQVTISIFDGTTSFELYRCVLAPDERVTYTDGHGFRSYNAAGAEKLIMTGAASPVQSGEQLVVLSSDVVNANAVANTMQDITGLSFSVAANAKYFFEFWIDFTAAATTTGSRFSINGPASPTELVYFSNYPLTATSETSNRGLTAYDLPAATSASSNLRNVGTVRGFIKPSASGVVTARFASEIASSAITAKAGSFCKFQQII
jgi:hypothetical protein